MWMDSGVIDWYLTVWHKKLYAILKNQTLTTIKELHVFWGAPIIYSLLYIHQK